MPSYALEYPREPFNTVKRYNTRANYALETIHTIINTSPLLHVSFNPPDSPFPTILPMIGQMGSFARPSANIGDVLELYLHGYVSSRIMNLSRNGADGEKGLPICVAASHVDGLVLALTPNSHSYNYRSASLFGYATVVTDVEEKLYAMELITNSVIGDRWRNTRVPPNGAEMQSTSVLRVKITTGSAKIRSGMPHDEKADMEDAALADRVWTGVVPVYSTLGAPVAGPYNKVDVPSYLKDYLKDTNSYVKEGAETAAITEVAPNNDEE
ncbi:flavin-nucleotide-binding protein [Thozetella sp. PMI_491]|nr:flavin-nucleotide-binding protein [Thozetella sp. PMI_491]